MRDYGGRIRALAEGAFGGGRTTWRRQLRSATLLGQLRHGDTPMPQFTFDEQRLASLNNIARRGELTRSARDRRRDPGQLPQIAQTYTDLAAAAPSGSIERVERLALAASTWSLAGFQANAAALAREYLAELDSDEGWAPVEVEPVTAAAPAGIAVLVGAILRRDVATVTQLGAMADLAVRQLGRRMVQTQQETDLGDAAVLAAYGLVGRAARSLARLWRVGDLAAGQRAVADVQAARDVLADAAVVDTWGLVDNLSYVVEDVVATSTWRLLRRAPNWNRVWDLYLRAQALADHPVVQVWPSQRRVLEAGLLDRARPNLTVSMPTSAGKTHMAEWAILDALAELRPLSEPQPLAVYIVPSRALAAEVERNLNDSLAPVGLRVSGLFGGSEHVDYELNLVAATDVLVVTVEKLDLLLRNDEALLDRIALVVADEGHLLGDGERGLRLELVLTRIRRRLPGARLLLLSAVLPNGKELAGWLDPGDRPQLAEIDWTPSTLRVGVFTWTGQDEEGQRGFVRYSSSDIDEQFFLPHVLVRKKRSTKLFPRERKDIAAALALHYYRLGPVLIVAPQKRMAVSAAKAVMTAARKAGVVFGVTDGAAAPTEVAEERERAAAAVIEFAGADHPLVGMVRAGVGFHHADVPEAVRQALERAYRRGALTVLCSTSTLAAGVNLPTKTVIISGVQHGHNRQLTVRDFRNTVGRAGRAFQETEGHAILVAETPAEASRLRRRYLDAPAVEPVTSMLHDLYQALIRARLPFLALRAVPEDLELPDVAPGAEKVAEILDFQLLALLAEEVVETDDEILLTEAVEAALGDTLGGWQLGAQSIPLLPLARVGARRVRALRQRVSDPRTRAAFLRTGLSLAGCEAALRAAQTIAATTRADPTWLGEGRWPELRRLVVDLAVEVDEVQTSALRLRASAEALPPLVIDWMAGRRLEQLLADHGTALGSSDPLTFARQLDSLVVNDLAWALSAVIQLLANELDQPLPITLTSLPAMVKYGVNTPVACYAASLGIRNRQDAHALAGLFPTEYGTSFANFLAWVSTLTPRQVELLVTPETAARVLRQAATLTTPQDARGLVLAEAGRIAVPLRGVSVLHTADVVRETAIGGEVVLRRDHGNLTDRNAIAVATADGRPLGYLAREYARVLAQLLDLEDGPTVSAAMVVRPRVEAPTTEFEARDTVLIEVTVTPRTSSASA